MIRAVIGFVLLFSAAVCRADDELDKSKLADCQVHVVGQYTPKNSSVDFRVKVHVKSTGKPMVVVLCSYMETQWNLQIAKDAEVRLILVSGWFPQSVVNVPDNIPIKTIIGGGHDYFYAYSKYSADGERMQKKIQSLLGKDIDTFQGVYEGQEFVVDGIRNQADPQTARSKSATNTQSVLQSWNSTISKMAEGATDRATVERIVRKLFELETNEKQQRIKQAEADLVKVKDKFEKRLAASEEIIKTRVDAFMKEVQSDAAPNPAKPN